ncbi:pyrimidine 5'-nucleotidase [Yoonia sp.]|uniref:pyrimidine 5'-nucleotidase n=1 Tax=Yoonia sp. TaxID=2212373 RepID=UPI003F6A7AE2
MVATHFTHVDTWVFDLDNTLYHPSAGLFALMDARFSAYVTRLTGMDGDRAIQLCGDYWRSHGSTLAGLMADYDVDPHEFLSDVHDIDISHLRPDPGLAGALSALPGRKVVFTNGSHNHAKRVLAARGLTRQFDAVYGVEHADFKPKPTEAAFSAVFAKDGIAPQKSAMFEDEARNLAVPHMMGMRTVHVHPQPDIAVHIHHHTNDLTGFLSQVARPGFPPHAKRPISA